MFDAIFKASNGLTFSFGYKAGVLWSITPLGGLPVDLETSQGYSKWVPPWRAGAFPA